MNHLVLIDKVSFVEKLFHFYEFALEAQESFFGLSHSPFDFSTFLELMSAM